MIVIYTIEFQKCELPHTCIILFLHPEDKIGQQIDNIISAEILDKEKHPRLYEVVKNFMIQGPCRVHNSKSPCMKNGMCSKYYPKSFQNRTTINQDGYPIYRRRDDGSTIEKDYIFWDKYVILHNPKLLLKYNSHINVEWCNQSRSIKYLFKYINKGHD